MSPAAFEDFTILSVIIRLVLATLIGFIVGIDRERKKRGAGTRTHTLVCMASCLVMLTSEYIAMRFPEFTGDITRLGAQVISGMGFIGAGTVIITRYNHVRGLTTAASLWATACLGLAIGIGFVWGGIAAAVIMMLVLTLFEKLDWIMKKHSSVHDYFIVFYDSAGFSEFLDEVRHAGIKIDNIEFSPEREEGGVVVYIRLEAKQNIEEFMLTLQCKIRIKAMNEV